MAVGNMDRNFLLPACCLQLVSCEMSQPMKIHIRKTVLIPEIPSEVEIEQGTLGTLLDSLLRPTYFAKEIIDPHTGDLSLDGLFQIELNGIPHHSLPDGFNTSLQDNDTLTLTLILLGGG